MAYVVIVVAQIDAVVVFHVVAVVVVAVLIWSWWLM